MDQKTTSSKTPQLMEICPGEAHLQNTVGEKKCYICNKLVSEGTSDIVLLRKSKGNKEMIFACVTHSNIMAEFIKQYNRPPLGWERVTPKETTE